MSSTYQSYDDALLEKLQCIAWSPWGVEVECLDVFTKVGGCLQEEPGFLAPFLAKLSALFGAGTDLTVHPRLLRQASMLKPDMARNYSAWREDPAKLRLGLNDLKDARPGIEPKVPNFTKELMAPVNFVCKGSKGLQFVLSGIGSVDLQHVKNLTCTLDDVMLASVPYEDIVTWTDGNEGSWFPNTGRRGLLWSRKEGSINSIWIVTGVFYAKALTVKGPDGVFAEIKVDAGGVVPGVPARTGLNVHAVKANEVEIKAPPRKHFIVGYRAIRLDYNPDGTPRETVGYEHAGAGPFRGDEADLASQCLKSMETDLFEVDEDGAKASIPWLAPSEAELNELLDAVESEKI